MPSAFRDEARSCDGCDWVRSGAGLLRCGAYGREGQSRLKEMGERCLCRGREWIWPKVWLPQGRAGRSGALSYIEEMRIGVIRSSRVSCREHGRESDHGWASEENPD